jgi:aminoglycoside phosphotransferase (APT) family kinase protein
VACISRWFKEHIPASPAVALIHNDYKYDNLVLDPGDLAHIIGVLDWEMCTLGDPLSDLGTALAYWVNADDSEELQEIRSVPTTLPGTLTRAQLVHRYALATGSDMRDIVFYLAFARFKVGVIIQQIYYRFAQGLTSDTRFAAMPRRVEVLMRASRHGIESGLI